MTARNGNEWPPGGLEHYRVGSDPQDGSSGSDVEGDVSGIYLGGGGDEISCDVLAAVVSDPGPKPEPEGDEPASDEHTSRKAVTSRA